VKISFVVLTYNRSDALLAVLRSLSRQCTRDHEVLIADDGSRPDEVRQLVINLPAFQCPVRHVWHPDVGFTAARARNLAASKALGDYIVFLDGDCIPGARFVKQHLKLAERGCFVNGSRVLLSEALSAQILSQSIDVANRGAAFWVRAWLRGDSNKVLHLLIWPWRFFRVKQGFIWRGIRSCNFGVWRDDFCKVNGFDEIFEGWGHEDADLVLRLSHLGTARKNGFMATEVFHLWHRENLRDRESSNKMRVIQRMESDQVQAERGLLQIEADSSVKITQLN
jgi:glycosyltransferase involved in cell wall biosynthesis